MELRNQYFPKALEMALMFQGGESVTAQNRNIFRTPQLAYDIWRNSEEDLRNYWTTLYTTLISHQSLFSGLANCPRECPTGATEKCTHDAQQGKSQRTSQNPGSWHWRKVTLKDWHRAQSSRQESRTLSVTCNSVNILLCNPGEVAYLSALPQTLTFILVSFDFCEPEPTSILKSSAVTLWIWNVPHRLILCLVTWFPAGGATWGGCGTWRRCCLATAGSHWG